MIHILKIPSINVFIKYMSRQNNYISIHLIEDEIIKSVSHEEVVRVCNQTVC